MKKSLFILFSLLVITSVVLTACGGGAAPAATEAPAAAAAVDLTVWHGYHAGGSEEATINQIATQYMNDNPNVKVTVLEVPFDQLLTNTKPTLLLAAAQTCIPRPTTISAVKYALA